jgi:PST family polysaccharide transporter
VILALAPTVLFSSLAWFYDALLQRELEFRRRFAGQVVQAATYAAVAILLAILGAGVWSLVVGQLAGVASYAAAFVSLAPYRVRPTWDRRAARDVLATSRGFLLLTGVAFLSQNVDYFAIGRALSATQMGFYSLAYRLGELPYWGIADPVAQATFPGFARMLQRGEDVRPSFLSVLGLVAFISCPLGVLLSGAAEPFTRAVFGDQWLPMVGPLAVLGIWAAIRPVQVTVAWLLNSVGHAGLMGAIDLALLVPLVPGALIAAHRGSITAVAYVMLAYMAISLVILALVARRQADVSLSSQWAAVRAVVVACPFAWGAARGASEILASAPPGTSLVAAVVAGTVGYAGIISLVEPGRLMQAAAQISRVIGRAPAPA